MQNETEWLKKVFKNRVVPQFEVNALTLSVLRDIAARNIECDRDAVIEIEDATARANEFKLETERMMKVIESCGAEVDSPASKSLSRIAVMLELKDIENSTFMMGLCDLMLKSESLKSSRDESQRQIDDMNNKIVEATARLEEIKKELSSIDVDSDANHRSMTTRRNEIDYYQSKTLEYGDTLSQLQESIMETGFFDVLEQESGAPLLSHSQLVEISESIKSIQSKTLPLLSTIQAFKDLPPDLSLARIQIEEAKHRLSALDQALSSTMDNII